MARSPGARIVHLVYARAVDDAAAELRNLRCEEWEDLGLGGLALAVAVAATQFCPALALPCFLGGLAIEFRGLRALWRRWDMVDRLAGDRDAYSISEVLSYAMRETTMNRRRTFAALVRASLSQPRDPRVDDVAQELESLARDLENAALRIDPASAVACMRLLSDGMTSPLLNPELPPEDLRARVNHIRSGFTSVRSAA
jgi:hypothetical protein